MKFKTLLASVLLGTAGLVGTANAAIDLPGTGNSELVFTAITLTQSYSLDLGINYADIASTPGFTVQTNTLGSLNLSDITGWAVLAADGSAGDGRGLQMTNLGGGATVSGSSLNQPVAKVDTMFGALNGLSTHDSVTNGSSLTTSATSAALQNATVNGSLIDINGSVLGNVGDTLAYLQMTETGVDNGRGGFNVTGFSYDILGTFSFAENGELSWNQAAPIPVPAAVWLFGSALVGLIGVGRRNKAA